MKNIHLEYPKQIKCYCGHTTYCDCSPLEEPNQVKCYDKFNQLLKEGDYVDVQKDGVQLIYKKEDGQLYFKPYGKEDRVSAYFSNDLVKCEKEEPKQETLEEAAENYENSFKEPNGIESIDFIEGAKSDAAKDYWFEKFKQQDKNKYSKEDMKQFGLYLGDNLKKLKGKTIDEIFEQFKK